MVPLREGIHTKKMKKPLRRVIEPVLTIVAVILLFTFVPWLSSGYKGNFVQQIESETKELEGEFEGEIKNTVEGTSLKNLKNEVKEKLKSPQAQPADSPGGPASNENAKSPRARIQGVLKGVGERSQQAIDESQDQP
jgi:hypothetical protein